MNESELAQHEEYIARLISAREYTGRQIYGKLLRRGVPESEAVAMTERLENAGLIDDSRYAVLFAASREDWGVMRIRAELVRRGVASETAKQEVPIDEEADLIKALNLVEGWRRFVTAEKIKGRLLRRGFSSRVVRQAMEQSCL